MSNPKKAPASTLNALKRCIHDLNDIAQESTIPLAQRVGALNRAQELTQQHLELAAARFNTDTQRYQNAARGVTKAIDKLNETIKEIEKITKSLENAQKLVSALDRMLRIAVTFVGL